MRKCSFLITCCFIFFHFNNSQSSVWWGNNFQLLDQNTLQNNHIPNDPNIFLGVINSNNQNIVHYGRAANHELHAKVNNNYNPAWHVTDNDQNNHITVYLQTIQENGYRIENTTCHIYENNIIQDTCFVDFYY